MHRITIGPDRSCYGPQPGDCGRCLANRITLRVAGGVKTIIAVGDAPSAGRLPALPPDAQAFDLVDIARARPSLAGELWGEFLRHLVLGARPSLWQQLPWMLWPRLFPVRVAIAIEPVDTRAAVARAICASPWHGRFRIERAD